MEPLKFGTASQNLVRNHIAVRTFKPELMTDIFEKINENSPSADGTRVTTKHLKAKRSKEHRKKKKEEAVFTNKLILLKFKTDHDYRITQEAANIADTNLKIERQSFPLCCSLQRKNEKYSASN